MRDFSRLLTDRILLKGVFALTLCYALMTQSLGGHHDRFMADASGLNAFCVNDMDATDNDRPSDQSHNSQVPCCLIFGSGHLPRISAIITAFRFAVPLTKEPHQEFFHPHKEHITTGPSQPRAPPQMG